MKYLITMLDDDEFDAMTMVCQTNDPNLDIKAAIKSAASEYIKTKKGKEIYQNNKDSFCWGDFYLYVPNKICKKYGFWKVPDEYEEEIVDANCKIC